MEKEMNKIVKVAVIIPCYNEQDNVLAMFNEIKNAKYDSTYFVEPIFINDCSTDHTKQILVSNKIHHLSLPVNLGIGGAVQTGFKYALRNGFDIAVQMDGDGQHPPNELEKIKLLLQKAELDNSSPEKAQEVSKQLLQIDEKLKIIEKNLLNEK